MKLDAKKIEKLISIINDRDKKGDDKIKTYKGGVSPTPTGQQNAFRYPGGLDKYLSEASSKGLDVSGIQSASDLQERIYESLMSSKEGQGVLKNMWQGFGDTLKGSGKVLPSNMSAEDLANLKSSFVDDKLGARTQMVLESMPKKAPTPPQLPPSARQYEGDPVYLPGIKGATGGTISNALVGFLKNGEYAPIASEDYQKYAVPTWAQESMSKGGAEEYLRAKLGGYFKGTKK